MATQTDNTITRQIAFYRTHINQTPPAARFMLGMEQDNYEEAVVEALTVLIPRLYALEFTDETDVPPEVYRLIDTLEHHLGLDFDLDGDEDE
jgi:hypothetical protein